MKGALAIRNRQRALAINLAGLRGLTRLVLREFLELPDFNLGICLVRAPEMARLNLAFLQHTGPTDVITFDYTAVPAPPAHRATVLHGEIVVCVDEAVAHARRYRSTWQSELARYLIHGILHLKGFDDRRSDDRRRMQREEARLLRLAAARFPLSKLRRSSRLRA